MPEICLRTPKNDRKTLFTPSNRGFCPTASALAPMSYGEVKSMIESLKAYPLIKGYRNKKGLNEEKFIEVVMRIGALVHIAPEISELDLNPIKADENNMIVVDSRICIDKNGK